MEPIGCAVTHEYGLAETLADLWSGIAAAAGTLRSTRSIRRRHRLPAADPRALMVNTDVLVDGIHFSDTTTAGGCGLACCSRQSLRPGRQRCGPDPGWNHCGTCCPRRDAVGLGGGGLPRNRLQRCRTVVFCSAETARREREDAGDHSLGSLRAPAAWLFPGQSCAWIVVTSGPHGLSRLGLGLLRNEVDPLQSVTLPEALKEQAIEQHQRPQPTLRCPQCAGALQATDFLEAGGTDSSDGSASSHRLPLCKASGCGAVFAKQNCLVQGMACRRPLGSLVPRRW